MALVEPPEVRRRGEALKEVREVCRLTQEEMAGALSVSKQAVSNWEVGRDKISYDRARAFVNFCHTTGRLTDSPKHVLDYVFGDVESFHSRHVQPVIEGLAGPTTPTTPASRQSLHGHRE